MATRALITYLDAKDGNPTLTTTYNHYDGYPSNLGLGLENFYGNDASAREIANVGYISYLDSETGEYKNMSTTNQSPRTITLPENFQDAMFEIAGEADSSGVDYLYVWDNENEEWIDVPHSSIEKTAEMLSMVLAHLKDKFEMFPEQPEQTMENKKRIKEGTWSVIPERIPEFIDAVEALKEKYHSIVGDDIVFNHLDGAIESAEELMANTAELPPEIPGFEGTRDALDALEENFIHKMKVRAGIIK